MTRDMHLATPMSIMAGDGINDAPALARRWPAPAMGRWMDRARDSIMAALVGHPINSIGFVGFSCP